MELHDSSFTLLKSVVPTTNVKIAFDKCDYAIMAASKKRANRTVYGYR